jgi:hypothetical protein
MFRNPANLENNDNWRNLESGELEKILLVALCVKFSMGESLVVSTWRELAVDFTNGEI